MKPILTSLSPNTEPDDVRAAWRVLLRPWTWRDDSVLIQLEQRISEYFDNRAVVFFSSGRAAIASLLRAHGISAGDEVIIQAFTCLAVPAAVQWAGATPVYADIDKTYNLDPASVAARVTPRTKAIIVQHTFGSPADIDAIKKIAAAQNIVLIEDCAHGLGGSVNGQRLGTFGDAAILSFGRDKVLSSVFGGAALVRDAAVADRLRREQSTLPYPPAWWVKQQLLHPLLLAPIKRLYYTAGLGKMLLVAAQKMRLLSLAVSRAEWRGERPAHVQWRFSPALAQLLAVQWDKLERYVAARQVVARKYQAAFSATTLPRSEAAGWLRYPLRAEQRERVLAAARGQRVMLGDWYDAPVVPPAPQSVSQYQPGSCPRAEVAAARVINLPTYPGLNPAEVARVIAICRQQ